MFTNSQGRLQLFYSSQAETDTIYSHLHIKNICFPNHPFTKCVIFQRFWFSAEDDSAPPPCLEHSQDLIFSPCVNFKIQPTELPRQKSSPSQNAYMLTSLVFNSLFSVASFILIKSARYLRSYLFHFIQNSTFLTGTTFRLFRL